jgi:hypothetical protein
MRPSQDTTFSAAREFSDVGNAIVATVSVSVDADYDNGAAV